MRCTAALVLIAALSACANKTPEQKLLDDVAGALSWVPALQMTGEKWLANSVPERFVASAADAAEKEFTRAAKAIADSNAPAGFRSRLSADIAVGSEAAISLQHAAASHDTKPVTAIAARLAIAQRDLDDLRDSVVRNAAQTRKGRVR